MGLAVVGPSNDADAAARVMTLRLPGIELKEEIEDFLYHEADLLDQRRFREWLDLLAEDLVYFMPMRRNVKFGQHAERENTKQGEGISWFDEDKWTLGKRVEQILTGVHYAEEPLSRVTHMVSNVRLLDVRPSVEDAQEVTVGCRFLVYQNRVEYENYTFIGRRTDELRRDRQFLADRPPRDDPGTERAAGEEPEYLLLMCTDLPLPQAGKVGEGGACDRTLRRLCR